MEVERAGEREHVVTERLLTIPNVLSVLRLLGVPVFLWAIVAERDALALALLMLSGVTDYLDGKIARRFNMESRLGQFLDPIADRLYILTTLVGLVWRDLIPVWLVVVILAREVVMALMLLYLRTKGQVGLPVHFVGKAATFNLLYAFPLLLLGAGEGVVATLADVFGWAFAIWGIGLYWWAGILYAWQVRRLLADTERGAAPPDV